MLNIFAVFLLIYFVCLSIKHKSLLILILNVLYAIIVFVLSYLLKLPIIKTIIITRCILMFFTTLKLYISFKQTFSNRNMYRLTITTHKLIKKLDSEIDNRFPSCSAILHEEIVPFLLDLEPQAKKWKHSFDPTPLAYTIILESCFIALCSGRFHMCKSILDSSNESNHLFKIYVKCLDYFVKTNTFSEEVKEKKLNLLLKGIEASGTP